MDLFTPRQLTALTTFSGLVYEAREQVLADAQTVGMLPDDDTPLDEGGAGPRAYADAVMTYLGLALSKLSAASTSLNDMETDNGPSDCNLRAPSVADGMGLR